VSHKIKVIPKVSVEDVPLVFWDSGVNPTNPDKIKRIIIKRQAGEKIALLEILEDARDEQNLRVHIWIKGPGYQERR
jgi:hypothetical protein